MVYKTLTKWTTFLENEEATFTLGKKLAGVCMNHSIIIYLHGELGAGKTSLVRGFLHGMGHEGSVKSPTYALVEPYELAKNTIFHFDFYRVSESEELEFIGIHDYFLQGGIYLIEWPEKGVGLLPPPDLSCYLQFEENGRRVVINANSEQGLSVLEAFQAR